MKINTSSHQNSKELMLYLIGYRLDFQSERPSFYNLMIYGDEVSPLKHRGYPVFFDDKRFAPSAFKIADVAMKKLGPVPLDVHYVCDIVKALQLLQSRSLDRDATLINCLNILDDLRRSTNLRIPRRELLILDQLSNHLTFRRRFGNYLTEKKIDRLQLIDALLRLVDAILIHSKFLDAGGPHLRYYRKSVIQFSPSIRGR